MEQIKITGIGADVEVFLQHKETKEIVSAEGLIRGSKYNPFVFDKANRFFTTSLDNVLAEFTIPPARSKDEFFNHLTKSLKYIGKTIPKELCTAIQPAARLDDRFLQTEQALTFGCEPDFNAYTLAQNIKPNSPDRNLRSAGGHVHIGYENPAQYDADYYNPDEQRASIIKALDLHIGVPSTIMEPDNKRKELYGKAGAFRPKPYGVEYRTISNFYLASKEYIDWVYTSVIDAINWLNAGNLVDRTLGEYVQQIINNNDKQGAKELINHFNLKLV